MKHSHHHKLDITCLEYVKEHIRVKNILLEFVKKIADEGVYEEYENLNELSLVANEILRIIYNK